MLRICLMALLSAACLVLFAPTAQAAREANWVGFTALSPDGSELYFTAWGDIWAAPVDGRFMARRLTDNVAYEGWPVVSPDGSRIAFLSDRFGNNDVYVMPAEGGAATRLTWDSGGSYIYDWTPDGSAVLEYARRNTDLWGESLYEVPLTGAQPRRVSGPDHDNHRYASYLDAGRIVYSRGPGDWAQKDYRGAMNYDLWAFDRATGAHRQLTDWAGNDMWPQPSPDGSAVYFVRNADGCDNLWVMDADGGNARQLTRFTVDGPRWPRISADGSAISFTVFGEPYVMALPDGEPRRVRIVFDGDPKRETQLSYDKSDGISEYAVSPNGSYFAFVNMGDVYVLKNPDAYKPEEKPDQDLSRAFRLTSTSGREMHVGWHPGSGKLAYISDRDGQYDVYVMDLATRQERRITESPQDEWYPSFAPAGERLAYYCGNRCLSVYELETGNARVLVEGRLRNGPYALGYDWAPDGQWIAYSMSTLDYLPDVFIVGLDGASPRNVSLSPDWDNFASFSADGRWLTWVQGADDGAEIMLLELNPKERRFDTDILFPADQPKAESPAAEEAEGADGEAGEATADDAAAPEQPEVKPVVIDFERIDRRARAITAMQGEADLPYFDPTSKYILFQSDHSGERQWWTVTVEGESYAQLSGVGGNSAPDWAPDASRLYFLDGGGRIGWLNMNGAAPGQGGGSLAATARVDFNQYSVWDQMLAEGWRYLRDGFYDPAMHGRDWEAVLARYRPRVQELGSAREFEELMREMLGELNASHLGFYTQSAMHEAPADVTADLGVEYDEVDRGEGWRVSRVVEDGPADIPGSRLFAGDLILSVNGQPVTPETPSGRVLNNLAGQPVVLVVQSAPGAQAQDAAEDAQLAAGDAGGPMPAEEPAASGPAAAARPADGLAAGQRRVVVNPVPLGATAGLKYEQWVEDMRAKVDALSGGTLAYQHIEGMNGPSLERFRRELFTLSRGRQGLIIDVRFNGGGNIHEQLVDILDRRPFGFAQYRDDERYTHPVLRWEGPIVVLINASSFSDAEIFPHIMQRLGLATIIGEPTGGNVIGTFNFGLLDGSTFRLPNRGWWLLDDTNLEGNGTQPDVYVHIDPGAVARGEDNQLAAAVDFLQQRLGSPAPQ